MTTYLQIPEPWLERPVRVLLIGAGGTGSHLVGALMALDHALRALDHPGGLHMTVYDPDRVTAANLGRQAFWPADVGQNKAVTLVQRANLALGLDWVAAPRAFRVDANVLRTYDLLLTAVDRARVRAEIERLYDQPYPESQRAIGPRELGAVLERLAGPAWQLVVDPVNRRVSFELRPPYHPRPTDAVAAPEEVTP